MWRSHPLGEDLTGRQLEPNGAEIKLIQSKFRLLAGGASAEYLLDILPGGRGRFPVASKQTAKRHN